MKRVKLFLSLMLAFALTISSVNTLPVSVSAATTAQFVNVPVTLKTSVDASIGTLTTQSCKGHFLEDITGSHSYYWTFTLTNPALVTISSNANIFTHDNFGNSFLYLSTDMTFKYQILELPVTGDYKHYCTALEAGTYYLRQDVVKNIHSASGTDEIENPVVNMSVSVASTPRTGSVTGSSKGSAIPLTSGKASTGIVTGLPDNGTIPGNGVYQQYFKFKTTGATTLDYNATFIRHIDTSFAYNKTLSVIDSKGATIYELERLSFFKDSGFSESVKIPDKGTYYIVITSNKYQAIQLTATWKNPKQAMKLKVNKIKKNAKKVTGTSVKKAQIKVKIGKKTYKGKASSKGKFTIKVKNKLKKGTKVKVTASKSGYKTKTVTVKVK